VDSDVENCPATHNCHPDNVACCPSQEYNGEENVCEEDITAGVKQEEMWQHQPDFETFPLWDLSHNVPEHSSIGAY
jgi:hypothetical protein